MQQSQAHSAAKKLSKPNATQLKAMQYNEATNSYNIPEGERGLDTIKQILAYCEEHSLQAPTFVELFLSGKAEHLIEMSLELSFPVLFSIQNGEVPTEWEKRKNHNHSYAVTHKLLLHYMTKAPLNQTPFYKHPNGNFYFDLPISEFSQNDIDVYFGRCNAKQSIANILLEPFVTAHKTIEKATLSEEQYEIVNISIDTENLSLCHVATNIHLQSQKKEEKQTISCFMCKDKKIYTARSNSASIPILKHSYGIQTNYFDPHFPTLIFI